MTAATIRRGACAALALGLLATAPVALGRNGADDGASRGDDSARRGGDRADVRVRGACTLRSAAKLKLSPENGRVEVEFEVDQNRVGRNWTVTLYRNGSKVLRRTATTRAPSGSFEVRALVAPGASATRVRAVARAASGGEVCRAVATLR